MTLSIIIPFYNESENVPLVLEAFHTLYSTRKNFELLCVNDGSHDKTAEILEQAAKSGMYPFLRVISYVSNSGYGYAIMTGVRAASGDVIAWTHADMQTPVVDIFTAFDLYTESNNKNILVKGWRTNRKILQVVLSFGMALFASIILHRQLSEINAQPKLFPKTLITKLTNAPNDFSLDLYLLCIAQNENFVIRTIPVVFPDRLHGISSWAFSWKSKLKTIWRSMKYIWKLRKQV